MKKIISISLLSATLLLTGCGQAGIGYNAGASSIQQSFEIGTVISQQKVLIDEGHMNSVVTGAAIGAGAGALLGSRSSGVNAVKGGLIGGAVGVVGGLLASNMNNNNEVEAFQISIRGNNGRIYNTYVKYDLPVGTIVEYIVRPNGEISNIDVKRAGKRVN